MHNNKVAFLSAFHSIFFTTIATGQQRSDNFKKFTPRFEVSELSGCVKAKIFQPFFTTLHTGQGTGLGLSLAYDMVTKGHGGNLEVETKEDECTEFKIILPC